MEKKIIKHIIKENRLSALGVWTPELGQEAFSTCRFWFSVTHCCKDIVLIFLCYQNKQN